MFRDFLFDWILDKLAEMGVVEEAADIGFDTAMDMCGNDGQVSIIDMTGYDAFHEAAEAMVGGGDGFGILMSACPYPDAVTIILEEAYGVMQEVIDDALGDMFGESDDDLDEESDDFFED